MEISPITKYGVTLRPLTHDKIELVRQWRNHPKIQQYMEYRDEITPEMQESWFQKISMSGKDFYFIIEIDGREIGLINIKNVNWDLRIGESGIFIWEDNILHTGVSYGAGLCLNDFAFSALNIEKMQAHILCDNMRSKKYFGRFGYKIASNQDGIYNQLYILESSLYFEIRQKIIDNL